VTWLNCSQSAGLTVSIDQDDRKRAFSMVDWQLTAKTIYCEAVDDEVTLMVYKNETTLCTGCKKYTRPNSLTLRTIQQKASKLKRSIKCEDGKCTRVEEYKAKILAEESR
jgi:hypothetical protein